MTSLRATYCFALMVFMVVVVFASAVRAEVPAVYQDNQKIAVSGYDVVAYFTKGKPVKGLESISAKHDGAIWHFSTTEHRDLFAAQPKKYAPQFGGYCAYAVSQGAVATTVPEAWSIVNGKLYLNYSLGVKTRWDADKANYIDQAKANWPGVLK